MRAEARQKAKILSQSQQEKGKKLAPSKRAGQRGIWFTEDLANRPQELRSR